MLEPSWSSCVLEERSATVVDVSIRHRTVCLLMVPSLGCGCPSPCQQNLPLKSHLMQTLVVSSPGRALAVSAHFSTQRCLVLDSTVMQHLPPGSFGQWHVIKRISLDRAEPATWYLPGQCRGSQSMALAPTFLVLLTWLVLTAGDRGVLKRRRKQQKIPKYKQ